MSSTNSSECVSTNGQITIFIFIIISGQPVSVACPVGCVGCTSLTQCTTCQNGYTKDNGLCIQCGEGCKSCEPTDLDTCTSCFDGSSLQDGSCPSCLDENCLVCPIPSFCQSCQSGYQALGGLCQPCPENCDECADGVCTTCSIGFSADSGECIECLPGCSVCSQDSIDICLTADSGYYLVEGSCVSCPVGCQSCSNSDTCDLCEPGMRLL